MVEYCWYWLPDIYFSKGYIWKLGRFWWFTKCILMVCEWILIYLYITGFAKSLHKGCIKKQHFYFSFLVHLNSMHVSEDGCLPSWIVLPKWCSNASRLNHAGKNLDLWDSAFIATEIGIHLLTIRVSQLLNYVDTKYEHFFL